MLWNILQFQLTVFCFNIVSYIIFLIVIHADLVLKKHFLVLIMLKKVVLLIFLWKLILYFVQEYDNFCHIINVIFDQFKLSLLNKNILKSYWHIWMIVYM